MSVTRASRGKRANRMAWEETYGPIPDGLHVLHRCDNPPCCNPGHLFLGTHSDNNEDKARKGRNSGKLSPQSATEIRQKHANGSRVCALAREFGVSHVSVIRVLQRKNYRFVS